MEVTDSLLFITDIIATVSFAISGALCAIDRRLDIVGVIFAGIITATGGGLTRDVLIGRVPAVALTNALYIHMAALTALAVFLVAYLLRRRYRALHSVMDKVNNVFDAIGLAGFTVIAVESVAAQGTVTRADMLIGLATINCVGGGIWRDVFTGVTPVVFRKHVYLLAALAGCVLYYLMRFKWDITRLPATLCAMGLVFVIRMLATRYRWELPHVILPEEKQ